MSERPPKYVFHATNQGTEIRAEFYGRGALARYLAFLKRMGAK